MDTNYNTGMETITKNHIFKDVHGKPFSKNVSDVLRAMVSNLQHTVKEKKSTK